MKLWGGAVLLIGFILIASSVRAKSTPSLNLEGTGNLGPRAGRVCTGGMLGSVHRDPVRPAGRSSERGRIADESASRKSVRVWLRAVCRSMPADPVSGASC